MNYPDIDDAPLPFELYTEEELEQMTIEEELLDWERSIPSPADRNPNLKLAAPTSPLNTLQPFCILQSSWMP